MPDAFRIISRLQDLDDFQGALTDGQFLRWNATAQKFELAVPAGGGSALPATDLFTGTDGAPLSSNWTTAVGTWSIRSNSANVLSGAIAPLARYNASAFNDNHFAEVIISALSGGSEYMGPALRINSAGTNGYMAICNTAGIYFRLVVNNVMSLTHSVAAAAVGDVVRLEVRNTTFLLIKNGVIVGTYTDATYASGWAGMGSYNNSVATGAKIASWTGGNL